MSGDTLIAMQAQQLWDRGDKQQALDLLEHTAITLQEDDDLEDAFVLFRTAYNFAVETGDLERAIFFLMQLIAITRATGDDVLGIEFLNILAIVQKRSGDFVQARETLAQSIVQATQLTDSRKILIPLWIDAGFVEREMGHLNKARECVLHALTLLEENNEQSIELVRVLTELAIIEKDQQNLTTARAHIEHALAVLHHHDAPRQLGSALVVQALIAELQNKIMEALQLYEKALVAYRQAGDRENEAQVLHNIGLLYDYYLPSKKMLKKALKYYQQSLDINREIGALQGIADNLASIATLFQLQGNSEMARQMYREVLQVYKGATFLEGEIEVLTNLGILERDEQHFDVAMQYLNSVVQKALEIDNPRLIVDAYRDRGDVALAAGHIQEALDDYVRVVEVSESMRALFQEEEALGYFTEERLKAYDNLVRLFVGMQERNIPAFTYMEQVKSREFLRRLRMSDLPRPQSVPVALLEQESLLLVQLRHIVAALAASTTADRHIVVSNYQLAEKQLYDVWTEIERYNPEYRDLRHGEPISWQELKGLLTFN